MRIDDRRRQRRILIYSHDSFGLGHLRRCRTIAHSLVETDKDLSVLILSGSPIIGSFDFRARVDFIRVPGVIKLRNGEYTSLNLHLHIEETLRLRSSIITHTAEIFKPDLLIVYKEPLGLRGEVLETLELMRERGVPAVLGLRDVMDEPAQLEPEWTRKNVVPALQRYYSEMWVYGLPQICDPLAGIALPPGVRKQMNYTGYLRRTAPAHNAIDPAIGFADGPFILVTPGGGGDGEDLVDWVLSAYETDPRLPYPALLVFGPFMQPEQQAGFQLRVARLSRVKAITFDARIETLMQRAVGVVAMGGYNTFCEILSFDKRALIVPRTTPRLEQYIRASRAAELGLVTMLVDDGRRDARAMATALRHLSQQQTPSQTVIPGLLEGLDSVNRLTAKWLDREDAQPGLAALRH
ncbi:MAG TPA: glycosyltransferase [Stellaceae bacterium]|nr:glycosyltransferase [Stellaceae bacterium]